MISLPENSQDDSRFEKMIMLAFCVEAHSNANLDKKTLFAKKDFATLCDNVNRVKLLCEIC